MVMPWPFTQFLKGSSSQNITVITNFFSWWTTIKCPNSSWFRRAVLFIICCCPVIHKMHILNSSAKAAVCFELEVLGRSKKLLFLSGSTITHEENYIKPFFSSLLLAGLFTKQKARQPK